MKKIFITIAFLAALGFSWHYRYAFQNISTKLPEIANSPFVQELREEISAPPPLIGKITDSRAYLTKAGVLQWTNAAREQNGQIPALKANAKLDQAAALKLRDMFEYQYFEHESPSGSGPGDLAREVRYEFLKIGENLALGSFSDDEALVEAWMNSPGHRANILNASYTEIGIAVGKGTYDGKTTWLAVQEFGRPATDCPKVSTALKSQTDTLRAEVQAKEQDLSGQKQLLESANPKTKEEVETYNEQVKAYNQQVQEYNRQLTALKDLIAQYNVQVNSYNSCLER